MFEFFDGMARWTGYGALIGCIGYIILIGIIFIGALLLAQAQR